MPKEAVVKIGRQESMQAYVRPDQKKALDALAKSRKVSAQSLIREALDLVLTKYKGVKS